MNIKNKFNARGVVTILKLGVKFGQKFSSHLMRSCVTWHVNLWHTATSVQGSGAQPPEARAFKRQSRLWRKGFWHKNNTFWHKKFIVQNYQWSARASIRQFRLWTMDFGKRKINFSMRTVNFVLRILMFKTIHVY